jgi:hypothetical protein
MRSTTLKRFAVIAVAVGAGLAVWGFFQLIGVEPTVESGGDTESVGAIDVALAAVVGGLAAWGVHALLARQPRTERWWPFVGSTALAISMIGPSYQSDGSSAMALMCMHFAVGAVLIAGFAIVGAGRRLEAAECESVPRRPTALGNVNGTRRGAYAKSDEPVRS